MIDAYFMEIETLIHQNPFAHRSEIHKTKLNDFAGVIKGRVFFEKMTLDFVEVIYLRNNPARRKKKYRYHVMTTANELVFRYDNARHYPQLKTFPHHKHVATDTDVIEAAELDMAAILHEIKLLLLATVNY